MSLLRTLVGTAFLTMLVQPAAAQNLLPNGSFDSGTVGWAANNGATLSWLPPPDSMGNPASGALRVMTGASIAAATGCATASFPVGWPINLTARARRNTGTGLALLSLVLDQPGTCGTDHLSVSTPIDLAAQPFRQYAARLYTIVPGPVPVRAIALCNAKCQIDLDEVVIEGAMFYDHFE